MWYVRGRDVIYLVKVPIYFLCKQRAHCLYDLCAVEKTIDLLYCTRFQSGVRYMSIVRRWIADYRLARC